MNKDDLKKQIRLKVLELLKVDEESSTGSGATFSPGAGEQYASNKAYNPNKKAKGTAHNYLKDKMGWKEAPSIPNRSSKMIDYKQLFQEEEIETVQDPKTKEFTKRVKTSDKDKETIEKIKALMAKELTNENYSRFRNETKTRSKSEQYHKAILEVKKRTNELNRLLEYAVRLKGELNQVDEIKSSRHTLNALDKVTETIKEVYIKAKKLK
jgi:hypothetical protein